jgi:hypothetical protein
MRRYGWKPRSLDNENELVCWIAADELGQIGPEAREAVPALQKALRRPFKMALVARGVALALQRIDTQAPVQILTLQNDDPISENPRTQNSGDCNVQDEE